jgi:nucleoporin NDC1
LDWVTYYSGDRARLNEKPLFFTTHFVIFGVTAAILHLFKDNDRLSLGVVKRQNGSQAQPTADAANLFKRFMDELPVLLISALTQSLASVVLSVIVYPIFIRGPVWRSTLVLFRPFFNLPKTTMVPNYLPFNVWLLCRCLIAGFLLSFVWMAGNTAFSIFLVKEPLKNGKPLTSESKDPNGSLLNGLKSKKLPIRVSICVCSFHHGDVPLI